MLLSQKELELKLHVCYQVTCSRGAIEVCCCLEKLRICSFLSKRHQ